jgi:hypothetical protein
MQVFYNLENDVHRLPFSFVFFFVFRAQVDTWVRATAAERLFPLFRKHFSAAARPAAALATLAEIDVVAPAALPPPADNPPSSSAVPAVSYVWRDVFLVKYACGGQVSVGLHRDGSSLR